MLRAFQTRLAISDRLIGRFLVGSMGLGFLALLIAGGAAVWVTGRNQEHNFWVNHTYQVELSVAEARVLIEQAETARRGLLLMPAEPAFLDAYAKAQAGLAPVLRKFALLTRDNPAQQRRVADLRRQLGPIRDERDASIVLVRAGRVDGAIARFRASAATFPMREIRAQLDAMLRDEQTLLVIRDADQRASVRAFYAALAIGGTLLVLVALVSLLTILRYTRDLAASRDRLRALNDNLEGAVRERTADLTRANEEIQRFAYIVSHDLRSPLVNVMGFTAELEAATRLLGDLIDRAEAAVPGIVGQEARAAGKEDLPEAIGFIRTSTQKMDRLINAILKLSREGRRVIVPEPLAMAAMVANIRDTLQHRLEAEGTTIVCGAMPDIVSDRFAIEQIFSNLIENAVKYLQPGRPGRIEVRGRHEAPRVIYEVADNGRGIDPRDHARVFDLFRRSGQQDQPGEGIGLAHVRALAYRLGGTIDVTSELGAGAIFRLSLPQRIAEPEETA